MTNASARGKPLTEPRTTQKKAHKTGHVLKVEGRDHPELTTTAYAGDLVALAKVEDIHPDQIAHDPAKTNEYKPIVPKYPTPMFALAAATRRSAARMSGR